MTKRDDIYEGFIEGTDQLDPADSLTGRIGEDPLDAGYSPPDREPVATRWQTTEAEVLRGETLDQRLAQEEPELNEDMVESWEEGEDPRAGRLVSTEDEGDDTVAYDAGRAGWAASAEEAAMHVITVQ